MVQLLDALATKSERDNRYQGDGFVGRLRQQLASLHAGSPAEHHWRMRRLTGLAELRMGNEARGLELLEEAYQLLPSVVETIGPTWANETIFRLAVCHMRIGETQNCCARFTPESCIVPIRGGAIHTRPDGSLRAIRYFLQVLKNLPPEHDLHMASRWLLNIAYMTLGGYPAKVPPEHLIPQAAFQSRQPFPHFTNVAPQLGVDRFNCSGGVIIDDFDSDGDVDILTSTWEPRGELRIFAGSGRGKFEDRSAESGLAGIFGGLNLVPADYDNDGDLDFAVLRGAWLGKVGRHPNSLIRNNGQLSFTDVTIDAGLGEVHAPCQTAAWSDYDNDGDVDLYAGNETTRELSAPCQLFENHGNGRFTDVAARAGVTNDRFTKGVTWGDYDNDGDPDLYVSNYLDDNRLYRNNGDGTFTDVAPALNLTRPHASFPVWFWDYNNDGNLDLFVSAYDGKASALARHYLNIKGSWQTACLYRGDGKGGFVNVAADAGLTFPMLPMGSNFGDLDGDGYLDFYLGTGDPEFASLMPNVMLVNRGGRFVDVTMAGGFGHLQKGHAVAFADVDADGDVDVFEQMGGAYRGDRFRDVLFENPGFDHRWLNVRCVGTRSNRAAIGARIRVEVETETGKRSIHRTVTSGGSFGANPLRQTIGLGKCRGITELEVRWPTSGEVQRFRNVRLDSTVVVTEGESALRIK